MNCINDKKTKIKIKLNKEYLAGAIPQLLKGGFLFCILLSFDPIIHSNVISVVNYLYNLNIIGIKCFLIIFCLYLTYYSIKGYKQNFYIPLSSCLSLVVPLFAYLIYFGHKYSDIPYFLIFETYKIPFYVVLLIPTFFYMLTLLSCIFYTIKYHSRFTHYRYTCDRPLRKKDPVTYNFDYQTKKLAESIRNTDISHNSFSLALTGEWGSGKTTFMNLLCDLLSNPEKDNYMWFNPRESSSASFVQADFLHAFSKQIYRFTYDIPLGDAITNYMEELNLSNSSNIIINAINRLRGKLCSGGKAEIIQILSHKKEPIYIFIDDLDRLSGEEILEVYKLINRNAAFPYVFFIAAFDKKRVNRVVTKYIGIDDDETYSDKYFNGEYNLPQKDYFTMTNRMQKILSDKTKAYGLNIGGSIISKNWEKVKQHTLYFLKTPRDLIRFANEFVPSYANIIEDVDFEDFWNLMLIKYTNISLYNSIIERRDLQVRKYRDVVFYVYKFDGNIISTLSPENEKYMMLINKLFPIVKEAESNNDRTYFINNTYRKIFIRKHFNSYFTLDSGKDCTNRVLMTLLHCNDEESNVLFSKLMIRHRYIIYSFVKYYIDEFILNEQELKRLFVLLCLLMEKDEEYFDSLDYISMYLTKAGTSKIKFNPKTINTEDVAERCLNGLMKREDSKENVACVILKILSVKDNISVNYRMMFEIIKRGLEGRNSERLLKYYVKFIYKFPMIYAETIFDYTPGQECKYTFNNNAPFIQLNGVDSFSLKEYVFSFKKINMELYHSMQIICEKHDINFGRDKTR